MGAITSRETPTRIFVCCAEEKITAAQKDITRKNFFMDNKIKIFESNTIFKPEKQKEVEIRMLNTKKKLPG